ncbi:hypothetical protein DUI87_18085 [Hirundo rustica rustica]|uniref:Endonuclease/exonuclease/phosphatase domain-containing protein n=1 Tax=Hirundo rustica rustica TaxID=333673 RepID=A0A3M0K0Z3_HIRRU|nr:hypothetical protein DUI87_18085 [Hirundo rustica rustica]
MRALAQSQRFDMAGISETWWDGSCACSALLDGSRIFRRDRQGGRGGGVAQYGIEGVECMELTAGNGTVESLWIRIKGQTNNADAITGVHYRPPGQDTDELLFEELRDSSKSTALVLMGEFNLAEINWEHPTPGTAQARIFLKTWMTTVWNRS